MTTIDHLVPIAVGGKDRKDNWKAVHRLCNAQRGLVPVEVAGLWGKLWKQGKHRLPCPAAHCPGFLIPSALGHHLFNVHGLLPKDAAQWLEWAVRRTAREAGIGAEV